MLVYKIRRFCCIRKGRGRTIYLTFSGMNCVGFKTCLKRCLKRPGTKDLSPGQTRMKVNKSGTLARVLSPTYVNFMHSHQPNRCTSREKSHADFRFPTLINSHSRLTAASYQLLTIPRSSKQALIICTKIQPIHGTFYL